jgi:hypothetical protein
MNVKIQGGGSGKYANTGSSFGAMQYLNHENEQRMTENKQIEPFFDHKGGEVDFATAVTQLDQNKAKLSRKDAKFFALTISPSEKEQKAMGETEQERSQAMKAYTRQVMDEYAKNFNKGLKGENLLYYAKIHHNREEKEGMHAHVIVSRKSLSNKVKLSPKTNHRNASRAGTVKSGFDRTNFYQKSEDLFDKKFNYEREYSKSFEYQNAIKNGTFQEKEKAVKQADLTPFKTIPEQEKNQDKKVSQETRTESLEQPPKKELSHKQQLSKAIYTNDTESFSKLLQEHEKELDKSHLGLIDEMKGKHMTIDEAIEKMAKNELNNHGKNKGRGI